MKKVHPYTSMKAEFETERKNLGRTMETTKLESLKNSVNKKEMQNARSEFSQNRTTSTLFFELLKKSNTRTIIGKKLALNADGLPTLNRTSLQSFYEEEIERFAPVFSNSQVLNSDADI